MKRIKLGDVLDVKRGASLSGCYYSEIGDKIRLTLGNFNYPGGGFKKNTSKLDIYFNGPFKPEYLLKKGDIITPLTEQVSGLLGETATIPESDVYIQSGDIGLVIPNEKVLNKRFAYYLVSSPIVKKQLAASAQQTKIRHTSPDAIKNCEAWIPDDVCVQAKIAKMLDDINDKIALNNSICSDLESMAKLLYDYWFMQFDFPDENGRPYKLSGGKMVWNEELKREIPEGWKVSRIGDLCKISRGVSYTTANLKSDGTPIISLASINRKGEYIPEGIKYYSGKYDESKVLKPYDAIMCNTDMTQEKEIVAKIILVPDIFGESPILSTHHISHLIFDDEIYKVYVCLTTQTKWFHNHIKGFSSGTNVLGLDSDGFKNLRLLIPTNDVLTKFNKIIMDNEKCKSNLITENQELASLRDFLLPMLMNGQIKIEDVKAS